MIQRIQSIYLALAVAALLSIFFFDGVWQADLFAPPYTAVPTIIAVLTLLTAAVSGIAIMLYSDRKRQRKIVVVAQVLTLILLFVMVAGLYFSGALAAIGTSIVTLLPMVLPIAAYALQFLARRGIDKDIALVKSMDRLR